jgi:hypothetical protein
VVLAVVGILTVSGCWATSEDDVGAPAATSPEPSYDKRYVSPDGRDTWPGSKAKPWRTLENSLPKLTPGQMLLVRGGVYREELVRLNIKQGRPSRRIVVEAFPGEQPLVRGVFRLREPSYWTVDGVDVTWDPRLASTGAPPHMVKLTGGVGWTWSHSEIWGAQAGANVLISGRLDGEPAHWSFTENCVHDVDPSSQVRRGSNIALGDMVDAGPGSLTRNVIFAVQAGRNIAFGLDPRTGGPTDVDVAYNTMYGGNVALSFAGETTDVVVERNLLGGPSSGVLVRSRQLKGENDVVRDNVGVDAGRFFFEQTGTLHKGNGNILAGAAFSDVSTCRGLRASDGVALSYGRDGAE